jgi:hypothetical protein
METSRMATITCSNCKLQGHKYTSYSEPLRPDLAMRKSNHKVHFLLWGKVFKLITFHTLLITSKITLLQSNRGRPTEAPGSSTSEALPCSSQSTNQAPPSSSQSGRGFMPYFNAGENAGSGRDASVPPLQDYAM